MTGLRILRPARQETYEKVFATVYAGLVTNLLLTLSCAPLLLALAVVRDPLASWPFFAALSAVCAPALAGAFRCFALVEEGSTAVLAAFWGGYRRAFGRAVIVWLAGAAAMSVLAVDAMVAGRFAWGPALVPFFVTAAGLVMAVAVAVLVVVTESPRGVRGLIRPCLYLVARRWYLMAPTLAVLALAVTFVLVKPLLGLLLGLAPLLYAVWATTRYVVLPLLPGS
ncbi:hypothetical protein Aph01nite_17840 [Acrocarpospora phusangensis]|uniref:Ferredoxin-NADPH reductase n=1 Tax=Acrocarpospora phusangensis TaxID=1070424 RepID=A0A919Q6S8_9ACTN|nr:hypothetical protein [Acrocarpospora phusangensis]GIH23474.1 hypothetical protein Aph01nite_17840 [Acrocarpospora phusangensis]